MSLRLRSIVVSLRLFDSISFSISGCPRQDPEINWLVWDFLDNCPLVWRCHHRQPYHIWTSSGPSSENVVQAQKMWSLRKCDPGTENVVERKEIWDKNQSGDQNMTSGFEKHQKRIFINRTCIALRVMSTNRKRQMCAKFLLKFFSFLFKWYKTAKCFWLILGFDNVHQIFAKLFVKKTKGGLISMVKVW